ncbi:MAG: two pore domain potassium channel family protein [Deltaproteobacteria bacterium]|nr:two pore domain potassium channel family protein [Deltaproteobacteria bacterium]
MIRKFYIPLTRIKVGRFFSLLISLLLLFVLRPFMESLIGIRLLMDVFVTFILISGIYAACEKKGILIVALVFALPAFVGSWSLLFMENAFLQVMTKMSCALFFAYTAIILMSYMFKAKNVTSDIIIGAICAFFLIGLMWAYIFATLHFLQPDAFHFSQGASIENSPFIYYSFVTLTTLGYGDITPLLSSARSLSLLEAVIGQIYLAVVIARLVGMHISQSLERKSP